MIQIFAISLDHDKVLCYQRVKMWNLKIVSSESGRKSSDEELHKQMHLTMFNINITLISSHNPHPTEAINDERNPFQIIKENWYVRLCFTQFTKWSCE